MKTKEFNLSEWIFCISCNNYIKNCKCDIPEFFISLSQEKEFIKMLKEEINICRDKTDIWADEVRWSSFYKMLIRKLNQLAGDKLK